MNPFRWRALRAEMVKVFMPFSDDELLVFLGEGFGPVQFTGFETLGIAQFHDPGDNKDRLSTAVADVNMNGFVIIAVEEKAKAVLFKNLRHGDMLKTIRKMTSKFSTGLTMR